MHRSVRPVMTDMFITNIPKLVTYFHVILSDLANLINMTKIKIIPFLNTLKHILYANLPNFAS